MEPHNESTRTGEGAPVRSGEWVSLFVSDEHPLLRLKAGLDWAALTEVMVTHWRAAGKNVDGGPGVRWPVPLYVPLLVLMWVKAYHARQMEEYLSESVVARRFLALQEPEVKQIRDHASIARAKRRWERRARRRSTRCLSRRRCSGSLPMGRFSLRTRRCKNRRLGIPTSPGY